ncbi:MAG: citryl-CoA lyase [Thermoplasmata archaeon]
MVRRTSISSVEKNRIVTRGHRQEDLIGSVTFTDAIFLLLKWELPSEKERKMLDAILVSCIDHGMNIPTGLAARSIASAGVPLPSAVAGGILAVGEFHGGAIEACMRTLYDLSKRAKEQEKGPKDIAQEHVRALMSRKEKMAGLGHYLHTEDPRVTRLFELSRELGISGTHTIIMRSLQFYYQQEGKKLPINLDGAIAAIACDMNFDHRLGKAFFLMGRAPGLVAQVYEEMTRERPLTSFLPSEPEYDGPPEKNSGEKR